MSETNCGFEDVKGGASGSDLLVSRGPTLLVDIGFDPAHDVNSSTASVPTAGLKGVEALVDTGATTSCIDTILASQLNLPIIDRQAISGAGGQHMANVYLAQIYIPSLNRTIVGTFAGVDLRAGGQPHSALIGRTFLRHCKMEYDGISGSVKISC
jgi:predicted aspartyl protease